MAIHDELTNWRNWVIYLLKDDSPRRYQCNLGRWHAADKGNVYVDEYQKPIIDISMAVQLDTKILGLPEAQRMAVCGFYLGRVVPSKDGGLEYLEDNEFFRSMNKKRVIAGKHLLSDDEWVDALKDAKHTLSMSCS